MSCLNGEFLLGAPPHGSGGREKEGESEKTSVPGGLKLTLGGLAVGTPGDALSEEQYPSEGEQEKFCC